MAHVGKAVAYIRILVTTGTPLTTAEGSRGRTLELAATFECSWYN